MHTPAETLCCFPYVISSAYTLARRWMGEIATILLVLLGTSCLFSLLDCLLIRLRSSRASHAEQARSSLEGSLEVTSCWLSPDPEESVLGFKGVLDGKNGLNNEAVIKRNACMSASSRKFLLLTSRPMSSRDNLPKSSTTHGFV